MSLDHCDVSRFRSEAVRSTLAKRPESRPISTPQRKIRLRSYREFFLAPWRREIEIQAKNLSEHGSTKRGLFSHPANERTLRSNGPPAAPKPFRHFFGIGNHVNGNFAPTNSREKPTAPSGFERSRGRVVLSRGQHGSPVDEICRRRCCFHHPFLHGRRSISFAQPTIVR